MRSARSSIASWPGAESIPGTPPLRSGRSRLERKIVPPPQCYVGAAMLGIGYIAARILMPDGKQEGIE